MKNSYSEINRVLQGKIRNEGKLRKSKIMLFDAETTGRKRCLTKLVMSGYLYKLANIKICIYELFLSYFKVCPFVNKDCIPCHIHMLVDRASSFDPTII